MKVDVFVNFNGNCQEAVKFYAGVFDQATPDILLYKDVPPTEGQMFAKEDENKVAYTGITLGGNVIMFSDISSDMKLIAGNNMTITVSADSPEDVKKYFNRMKEGGQVYMELQKTFWSPLFGMLVDKFGVPWQFGIEMTQ